MTDEMKKAIVKDQGSAVPAVPKQDDLSEKELEQAAGGNISWGGGVGDPMTKG
jgi:hypothetical protein